ncbi:hypothetical protein ACLQ2Q_21475 [Microbacterium sp. DT81.1]
MTASIIDSDREATYGLPHGLHQHLAETHRALTAQTTDAPDPTKGTDEAEEAGSRGDHHPGRQSARGQVVTVPFPSTIGG